MKERKYYIRIISLIVCVVRCTTLINIYALTYDLTPDTFCTMKLYLARHTLLIINTNSCQTYTSLYDYKSSKQHTYFSPFFLEHELTRVYLRKYCKTTYSGLTIFS